MADVVRLSPRGRAARLAATGAVLAALAYGTVWGTDDHFPFGPLTQYAFAADPDGAVPDLYIEAETAAGAREKVRLDAAGAGIVRAEIEGQLDAFRRDPSRLQAIADSYHRLHPEAPRYVALHLRIRHVRLRGGVSAGEDTEHVADWVVR